MRLRHAVESRESPVFAATLEQLCPEITHPDQAARRQIFSTLGLVGIQPISDVFSQCWSHNLVERLIRSSEVEMKALVENKPIAEKLHWYSPE